MEEGSYSDPVFPSYFGPQIAVSKKDEKQIIFLFSSAHLQRIILNVAITCQPSDSDSTGDITSHGDSTGYQVINPFRVGELTVYTTEYNFGHSEAC